jgi:hypothetical protein
MDREPNLALATRHRRARRRAELVPVVWIAILLASWLIVADWKMLPDLVSATVAALP